MFIKLVIITVICQILIINTALSASIRNSTTTDNLSTTSTTPKSSIIQHSNSNFSIAPRTETITLGTTFKPNLFEKAETTEKTVPKKLMRGKKAAASNEGGAAVVTTISTPNDELANAIKEKFAKAQNRIQDVFNNTKEKIQAQNKKFQEEMDVSSNSDAKVVAASEMTSENKKDKKEGGSNAKIAADTISASSPPSAASIMPTLPSIDESIKPITGAGIETLSFSKTVDLPIINKPNDKQNVFVVGDKGNATFSRTLNSLSVEAHNIL
uniref:Uncharacterized protein n=1 Tax=Panagrolaimus sp. PS1159 TaxID=55785 RepID=A0AC35G3R4_9BILA